MLLIVWVSYCMNTCLLKFGTSNRFFLTWLKTRFHKSAIALAFFPRHFNATTGYTKGFGVFGISLGTSFETSGFLYSSLYLLLEKLTCSNYHIRSAADVALRMLSESAGYPSVGVSCFMLFLLGFYIYLFGPDYCFLLEAGKRFGGGKCRLYNRFIVSSTASCDPLSSCT